MGFSSFWDRTRSFANRRARRRALALARAKTKRSRQRMTQPIVGDVIQCEPLEPRVLLSANAWDSVALADTSIALTVTVDPNVLTIHDESDGVQNTPATLDPTTDDNGTDVALDLDATNPAVPDFPSDFSARLTALGADPSGAIGAALSGYDGSNNGLDVVTFSANGANISNLALTDGDGNPLDGRDSGVTTTASGNNIFLYTDTENDNIVVGREGAGMTADPNGNIALAFYLDENADLSAAKIWTVQYEAIFHDLAGDGSNSPRFAR